MASLQGFRIRIGQPSILNSPDGSTFNQHRLQVFYGSMFPTVQVSMQPVFCKVPSVRLPLPNPRSEVSRSAVFPPCQSVSCICFSPRKGKPHRRSNKQRFLFHFVRFAGISSNEAEPSNQPTTSTNNINQQKLDPAYPESDHQKARTQSCPVLSEDAFAMKRQG